MKTKLLYSMLLFAAISFIACDDNEKPQTIPEVITATITNITSTSAMGGGEISSNGNAKITASGLVYSSTNTMPTIADSKAEGTATSGAFTSTLENLTTGSTYYVRAYATNSVGTGYGEVVSFTTDNGAPVATGVTVAGAAQVPEVLTVTYTYNDSENDVESGTTIQWYRANDGAGSGEVTITGATESAYTLQTEDEFKYIRVGITPKAATGTTTGTEVKSAFVGPVAEELTTVTFIYNGSEVTYGILISSVTGRRWLDRNLGAPNAPSSWDDYTNYGDSFQWGRGDDGHQLVNRAASSGGTTGVNGITATLSSSDDPGHNKFIIHSEGNFDWRNPQNHNLWQGVDGINNPCPEGWRIPTKEEWMDENLPALLEDAYNQLNITAGGARDGTSGGFYSTPVDGYYWSSSPASGSIASTSFWFRSAAGASGGSGTPKGDLRNFGLSCRCIKNQ